MKIIIEGITQGGDVFRPTDWAERLSGPLSTFKGRRIRYSELLHPSVINGAKCLVVDAKLAQKDTALYHSILAFANNNNLKIHHETGDETHDGALQKEV